MPPAATLTTAIGGLRAGTTFEGHFFVDALESGAGAEILARFSDGAPALLGRRAGKGRIVACATDVFRAAHQGARGTAALGEALVREAGAQPWTTVAGVPAEYARELEVVLREKGRHLLLFALNANPAAVKPRVKVRGCVSGGTELVTGGLAVIHGSREVELALDPYQCAVVELARGHG